MGAFIDGEAIGQFHQRGRRPCFRSMQSAGDVVDRHRRGNQLRGLLVIHLDFARIGELRETRAIFLELREVGLELTATAIISRPSSDVPIENTFTRGLAFSSILM